MQLDTFISETLKSIIKGVKDTQDFAQQNGARINPHIGKWDMEKVTTVYFGNEEGARFVSAIDFDIAVTTSSEKETGGQGGINVLSLSLGGKLNDKDINETVSRIKFRVNVVLPNTQP